MSKMVFEGIPKYCLQTLIKVSKRLDKVMPLGNFEFVDKTHVSMFRFEPVKEFPRIGAYTFEIGQIPQSILEAENILEVNEWEKTEEEGKRYKYTTVKLNGYNISGIRIIGEEEKLNFKLDFDREDKGLIHLHTTGKKFKPMVENATDGDIICYYRDEETSCISIHDSIRMFLSYDVGDTGFTVYCNYPAEYVRKIKDVIPNGDIELIVAEEYPLGIRWFDSMGNRYTYAVAPNISSDYEKDKQRYNQQFTISEEIKEESKDDKQM